jgi:hypothetical protein
MKWGFGLLIFFLVTLTIDLHAQESTRIKLQPRISLGWNRAFIGGEPIVHNLPHEKYGFKAIDGDYFTPDKTDLPKSFNHPISISGGISIGTRKSNSFFIGLGYNRYKLEQESNVFLRYADMISPGRGFVMPSRYNLDGGYHLYEGLGVQGAYFFHDAIKNLPIKIGLGFSGQWIMSKYFLNHTDAISLDRWDFTSRDIELKDRVFYWAPMVQLEGQVFESQDLDISLYTNFQMDVFDWQQKTYFGNAFGFGLIIHKQ